MARSIGLSVSRVPVLSLIADESTRMPWYMGMSVHTVVMPKIQLTSEPCVDTRTHLISDLSTQIQFSKKNSNATMIILR